MPKHTILSIVQVFLVLREVIHFQVFTVFPRKKRKTSKQKGEKNRENQQKQQKLEKYLTEEVKSGQNLFVTKYFQNGISSFDHSAA